MMPSCTGSISNNFILGLAIVIEFQEVMQVIFRANLNGNLPLGLRNCEITEV
jgi:hypothetical protein